MTRVAPQDLWQRIRAGMAIPTPGGRAQVLVDKHRSWYLANGGHMQRVFTRARPYLFEIVEAVEREGLPMEVALLPAVESAFIVSARSSAAADGLWQFIAPTARRYDLKIDLFKDDRRNLRAATQAALRYLKELSVRYQGDYQLALAAYNCGEGCIDAAIRRARERGTAGRFEDLALNPETANYVPRLLALSELVALAADKQDLAGQKLPAMPNAPYLDAVRVRRDIDVTRAAALAGMALGDFKALNAQHTKPMILAADATEIMLPMDRKSVFEEAMANFRGALASWTAFKVDRTSSAATLAARYQMDLSSFRAVNGIPMGHQVKAGSTVVVPRRGNAADIPEAMVQNARLETMMALVSARVRVRAHESWGGLAERLQVTEGDLRLWNPAMKTLRAGSVSLRLPADVAVRTRTAPAGAKGTTPRSQRPAAAQGKRVST